MKKLLLFDPTTESQGNGNVVFVDAERQVDPSLQTTETPPASTEAGQTSTTTTPTPPATVPGKLEFTPEQLAAFVKQSMPTQPAAQPQRQLTQDEFNKQFNVVQVTPQQVQDLLTGEGTPEQKALVLQKLLHDTARQAVTMAGFQQNQLKSEFNDRLTPLQAAHVAQQEAGYRQEFMTKFPEFKGYEPLLEEIYKGMSATGTKFSTPVEAYNAIATKARALIPVLKQGAGGAGAGASGNITRTNASSRMPTLSGGGQGGAGGKSGSQAPLTKGQAVFS